MQAMGRRRSGILGALVLGFGAGGTPDECEPGSLAPGGDPPNQPIECPTRIPESGGIAGACAPNKARPVLPGVDPSAPQPECPAANDNPCMRYLIPLVGDPNANVALRAKYVAAFGSACYMSEANPSTFNCFYKPLKKACEDAALIGEVSGNAPYDKGYMCQPVGNGDYTLQIGSDVANKLFIYLKDAPRQTPFIDVNGTPTEINGPYRNLPEPQEVGPGELFSEKQRDLILQANSSKHGGTIHSDLAGFMFPCEKGKPKLCPEPDVLNDPPKWRDAKAEVHHVVPKKDQRCCPWGTNSNKNAVVISHKLNEFLTNNDPPVDEVLLVNKIPPYTP